jgi:hypothetical protein
MRLLLLAGVLTLIAGALAAARRASATAAPKRLVAREASKRVDAATLRKIRRFRHETWRWQRLMGRPLTPARHPSRHFTRAYGHWAKALWRARAHRARKQARRPPHRPAWVCIQRYEASWNDRHAPYYGGLQMDLGFQRTYGADLLRRKGTADNWTPLEQMWVAERAHRRGRGFYPWPNAARLCNLL